MSKTEELRTIPLRELKEIANTLRMVSNALGSPERETCLDRNIMRSWNNVVDIIKERESTIKESMDYYYKKGQTPSD